MLLEPFEPVIARKNLTKALVNGEVVYSYHALERMKERNISADDVVETLHRGIISRPAEEHRTKNRTLWRYRVDRDGLSVIFAFNGEKVVVVVTTFDQERRT